MRLCPECGQSVEAEQRLCPHCGASLPLPDSPLPPEILPVWPPPPSGFEPPPPAGPGPLLTKSVRGDVALGFVAGGAISVILPLLGAVLLAFVYREKLPSFARGAKYCAWTQGALLLGALALCFSQLARVGR